MDLPERFRGDSDNDDDDDVTKASEEHPETFVQQSVYGIIAAAQSRGVPGLSTVGLDNTSTSESEGDGEYEDDDRKSSDRTGGSTRQRNTEQQAKRSSVAIKQKLGQRPGSSTRHQVTGSASRRKPFASVLDPVRDQSASSSSDRMSQSQILSRRDDRSKMRSDRPPRSLRQASDKPYTDERPGGEGSSAPQPAAASATSNQLPKMGDDDCSHHATTSPSQALAEVFNFDHPEDIISDHPCWYLQNVLLQGHMYITKHHVCFYAYLPKKGHVVKSGYLSKQGKRSSRYRRHWFTLKAGVLSYYSSAAEPFFPSGTIDLRFAHTAEFAPDKDNLDDGEPTTFTVTTDNRTYYLRAESHKSANEWVRQLQKIIFRSHNEGDSVKISMPVENIVDVEPNPIVEFAETVKIRVIDSEQTYAVDEYFFTFFNDGRAALENLNALAETKDNSSLPKKSERASSSSRTSKDLPDRPAPTDVFRPPPTERSSLGTFRKQLDRVNRPEHRSDSAELTQIPAAIDESEDSLVNASDQGLEGSSVAEINMSASQMLTGDTAFQSPTFRAGESGRQATRAGVHGTWRQADETANESSDTDANDTSENIGTARPDRLAQEAKAEASKSQPQTQASGLPLRTITAPLQHAFNLAGVVRNHSKKVGFYLGSSPKSYYDKFSGALAGGKRHYTGAGGSGLEDDVDDPELDMEAAEHERRFQQHFALSSTERLRAVYYCSLHRVLPLYGKVYISDQRFCFRSLLYGTRTKLVVPFTEIDNIAKDKGFRWRYPGMVLIIRGHEELFFDFGSTDARDDCVVTVLRTLDALKSTGESLILTADEKAHAGAAAAENEALQGARKKLQVGDTDGRDALGSMLPPGEGSPVLFDDPSASVLEFKPKQSMRITCLTIGSRGDVQPYIALCKGLKNQGHEVRIATHSQFEGWIRSHGIDFASVVGDPAELMRMCVENGMFTPSFLYEANSKFRTWLDGLLESAWEACAGSDLLIESPSAMAGIHIAEALGIPYFRAFTMPWTKTRAYPHAFAMRGKRMGGQYNYTSYMVFDYVFWQAIATQINRWRRKTLNLKSTDYTKMQSNKVPFLYNFSPCVVPPPLDFSDWIRITGYWFLDEGTGWKPSQELTAFIDKAREDHMKLVYVGFGSVPVSDSRGLTQQIVDAVVKADVRCILSKGWSDHFAQDDPSRPGIKLPASIFEIRSAPHDWLFQQIDAAVHHGGAGTTGASLRAGVPTVVKPFFGDQFFFATRVEDLGVGIHLQKITVNALGKAIWCATHDERMRTKARVLGEKIRREDGVATAINAIYRDLEYAKTLIKKRETVTAVAGEGTEAEAEADVDADDQEEESWTFVENDSDVDVTGIRRTGSVPDLASRRLHQSSTSLNRRSGLGLSALRP